MGSTPIPSSTTAHIDFRDFLQQHIRSVTVDAYLCRLERLSRICNLNNPEKVKSIICSYPSSESYKELLAHAYEYYVRFNHFQWVKPHFVRQELPIFLPLEKELDALIARPRLKLSVFLQFLKETGADSGEAQKLRWIDIDTERSTVAITPTKNHLARILPASSSLINRMNQLPRKTDYVFNINSLDGFRAGYEVLKNNLSVELNNPRIAQIAFRSFRHWKATSEYAKTKDILYVKQLLGHKRLENTLVYTHLVNFGSSDDYICKVGQTLEECCQLIEQGFEYVTEMDGVKIFKKRK
jgi:integrase